MPNGHHEVPLSDAEQAIRMVREHAAEWGVNPQRVGIMGASAGGHLAASLATLYSSDKTRPDFQILFYPVISMQKGVTHGGSRKNLIGENPSQELEQKYSLERQVSPRTPQAFIMLSSDDDAVPPINGIGYLPCPARPSNYLPAACLPHRRTWLGIPGQLHLQASMDGRTGEVVA